MGYTTAALARRDLIRAFLEMLMPVLEAEDSAIHQAAEYFLLLLREAGDPKPYATPEELRAWMREAMGDLTVEELLAERREGDRVPGAPGIPSYLVDTHARYPPCGPHAKDEDAFRATCDDDCTEEACNCLSIVQAERDAARAEVARLRPVADAAIAHWRENKCRRPVDTETGSLLGIFAACAALADRAGEDT